MAEELTGLQKVRYAVCVVAGWEWCDEHRSPRWDGAMPCAALHPVPPAMRQDDRCERCESYADFCDCAEGPLMLRPEP